MRLLIKVLNPQKCRKVDASIIPEKVNIRGRTINKHLGSNIHNRQKQSNKSEKLSKSHKSHSQCQLILCFHYCRKIDEKRTKKTWLIPLKMEKNVFEFKCEWVKQHITFPSTQISQTKTTFNSFRLFFIFSPPLFKRAVVFKRLTTN